MSEFPTGREEIIAHCKRKILYRARYMILDFDRDDIKHFDEPDEFTVVFLTHIYGSQWVPDPENEGEYIELKHQKIPTINAHFYECEPDSPRYIKGIGIGLSIQTRFPELVALIDHDGKVKMMDTPPAFLEGCDDLRG